MERDRISLVLMMRVTLREISLVRESRLMPIVRRGRVLMDRDRLLLDHSRLMCHIDSIKAEECWMTKEIKWRFWSRD